MKMNTPITDNEVNYSSDCIIVSTTDLKGALTYVNDDFIKISGFTREELIGKNHNIVRHPDIPPAAFADLWKTLHEEKAWMGIIKNRCKNGDYYWVDAYVTPIFGNKTIVGYQSVRVQPDREDVARAENLYKKLTAGKTPQLTSRLSMSNKIVAGFSIILAAIFCALFFTITIPPIIMAAIALPALGATFMFAQFVTRPLVKMQASSQSVVNNPVMQAVYTGVIDETGAPQLALRILQARLRTVIGRISDSADNLNEVSTQTAATVEQAAKGVLTQQSETNQVATAMHQMTATVQEVARNAEQAASASYHAKNEVDNGHQVMKGIIDSTNTLASEVERAAEVIQSVEEHSNQIGVILQVIKDIAEQTNLLALNAAIEAARAGDQGRGFAVVADEVRTLAQRTQQSTEEIHNMINQLQTGTKNAVGVMQSGRDQAMTSVTNAALGGDLLNAITHSINTITDMNTQIASAAEEQSAVAEEINRNIINISQVTRESAQNTEVTLNANQQLSSMINEFDNMSKQFGN